ncbi:hypothetical protein F5Y18DRAFT_406496 [Xylariaceae sp. FL1019]|nr:hypothetical protein F5Y18DRAFT_406496 [Xylariaceae sp. FL1019]
MAVAMAWPDHQRANNPEKCHPDQPMSEIDHGDFHDANMMFGEREPLSSSCHPILPVLKLIDFAGSTGLDDTPKVRVQDTSLDNAKKDERAVARHVFYIGKTMALLVLLNKREIFLLEEVLEPERDDTRHIRSPFISEIPIVTVAAELVPTAGFYADDLGQPHCEGYDQDLVTFTLLASTVPSYNTTFQLSEMLEKETTGIIKLQTRNTPIGFRDPPCHFLLTGNIATSWKEWSISSSSLPPR